jgi:hypothetical protein
LVYDGDLTDRPISNTSTLGKIPSPPIYPPGFTTIMPVH